jgi:hypothetical protein
LLHCHSFAFFSPLYEDDLCALTIRIFYSFGTFFNLELIKTRFHLPIAYAFFRVIIFTEIFKRSHNQAVYKVNLNHKKMILQIDLQI